MSLDRNEALKRLAREQWAPSEEEVFTVDYFRPSDAPGVARLFYTIYGEGYPVDTYYIPERLIEENRRGAIRSVVARTSSGDIVSHVALYRSSPPNPNLYEYGVGLTLPAYRSTMAFARANQLLIKLIGHDGIHGFYGEAVCNHVITQKLSRQTRAIETALQPALMPPDAYETKQSATGRVGCLVFFRVVRDIHRALHVPDRYEKEIRFILDGLHLNRELISRKTEQMDGCGEIDVKRFDFAGVARCTITAPGKEIEEKFAGVERQLRSENYALIQFFIDLGKPWSCDVVEKLHSHGYCFGGLLPTWFGDDGLLMQKHFVDPDFDSLQIYSERGRSIAAMVRRDWEQRVLPEG
ncbi:MAG: hypothetical protein GX423_04840 [Nitrospiraceae bacterium]|jgi:hypothetical protein|nr:hypothetical protein [Nitrospiraceae bacterium]